MTAMPIRLPTSKKPITAALRRAVALWLMCLLAACSEPSAPAMASGISGMARIDDSRYLVVRDLKDTETGARLGILQLNDNQRYSIADVAPVDWVHDDGPASDLEAACAIPGLSDEFLLLESGHWLGSTGRLFRVRLDASGDVYSATVIHVFELPEFNSKGPEDPGDEMEGLACVEHSDGRILAILGERGGSSAYRTGLLRWLSIDLETNTESWTEDGSTGLEVDAPGGWHDPQTNRDISALHVHSDGSLWAAASEDLSDEGPFSSIVFQLGKVQPDRPVPIQLVEQFRIHSVLSGFKVEALAAGSSSIPDSNFAIGTEDEAFGGTWRPLR